MVSRLMAPHWRDWFAATAPDSRSGKNVSPKEIELFIKPHADILKTDQNYRQQVRKLLSSGSGPHATPRAEAPLKALLASTGPKYEFKAQVIGSPSYSPGMGIVPANPPPDMVFGP